jgi:hypothetical protein
MEAVNGKDIVCCFNTVNQIWEEIELMADRLTTLLRRRIADSDLHVDENDEADYEVFDDDHSNVFIGMIKTVAVKSSRKKRKPDLFFGFQVSLAGKLISIPGNEEPILYMIKSSEKFDFSKGWIEFPLCEQDGDDINFSVENNIVLQWDGCLAFGVKMLSLKSDYDLINLCVDPLISLHVGKSVAEVFGENPDDSIVRFPPQEKLIVTN